MKIDVLILGGGCGGLTLLHELSHRQFRCMLVDSGAAGRFASTGNQGWLQSGALYAMRGDARVGQNCLRGHKKWRLFCHSWAADAVASSTDCIFVVEPQQRAQEEALKLRRVLGFQPEVLTAKDLARRGLVHARTLDWGGLATPDIPFNSYKVLDALRAHAVKAGAGVQQIEGSLADVSFSRADGGWKVNAGGQEIHARIVVAATGALIPEMLGDLVGNRFGLTIQKSVVAVLHHRILDEMMVFQVSSARGLNVVPFSGGVTVNLGEIEPMIDTASDLTVWPEIREMIAAKITFFLPQAKWHPNCLAHFYVCQKLNNTDNPASSHQSSQYGVRHHFWLEEPPGIFWYYPGKFTAAPVGSSELADLIERRIGTPSGGGKKLAKSGCEVAKRAYGRHHATHIGGRSGSEYAFVPFDQ